MYMGGSRGGGTGGSGPLPPPPEISQNVGFLSIIDPDPLGNDKATKPAFKVWPPSARQ